MEKMISKLKGYENVKDYYYVEETGKIISYFNGRKELSLCGKRYKMSTLKMKNGRQKSCYVHRVVALAFVRNKLNKEYVNHKDQNILNNNKNNLEWVTPKENVNYGDALKRRSETQKNTMTTSKKY